MISEKKNDIKNWIQVPASFLIVEKIVFGVATKASSALV